MSYGGQNYLGSGQGAPSSGQGYQSGGQVNPSYGLQSYQYSTQPGQQQTTGHGTTAPAYYSHAYQQPQQQSYASHQGGGQSYHVTYPQSYATPGFIPEVAPPPAPPPLELWIPEGSSVHGGYAVGPTQQYYTSGGATAVMPYVTLDGSRATSPGGTQSAQHQKQQYASAISSRQSPYQQPGYQCQRSAQKRY